MSINDKNEVYLSVKDTAKYTGFSVQHIRNLCKKEKFKYRKKNGNGGVQYTIALSSLPEKAKVKYFESLSNELKPAITNEVEKTTENSENEQQPQFQTFGSDIYSGSPEFARKKADKYLRILNECSGLKGEALKQFVNSWNHSHPSEKTSYRSIMRASIAFEKDGAAALVGKWGKRESGVSEELFSFFKTLYLKESRPSIESCWKITLSHAKENGFNIESFPSCSSFIRKLNKDVPEQAIYIARYGYKAADKKYGFYLKRDYEDVLAGECWVGDHCQVDIAVSYTDANGRTKYGFPWVTAFRDFKSGKWLGWDFHIESPCSDHIFLSFYRAGIEFGICSTLYLDNGKDYRCKDFAGGRSAQEYEKNVERRALVYRKGEMNLDEKKITPLTQALGIKVIYAWPYNAQSKSIERDFLRNKEWFSKHDNGYRGGNIVERPESLSEFIKNEKILSFEEFEKQFTMFITEVINKSPVSSGYRKDKYPDQMWDNEIKDAIYSGKVKRVTKNALMLFCYRISAVKKIGRRGYYDSEFRIDYYDEWMEGQRGRLVYLRRDPKQMQEAWVFDAKTSEYLGQAFLLPEVSALAYKSDVGKTELQRQIAIKRQSNKIQKALASTDTSISIEEKVSLLAGYNKIANEMKERTTQNLNINEIAPVTITAMDKVLKRKKEVEGQSNEAASYYEKINKIQEKLEMQEKKRSLFFFPSDKEEHEKRLQAGER